MVFSFEHRNLWWVGKVPCTFLSQEFCLSADSTNSMAAALRSLECTKSLSFLNGE
jgi:hypothetical protein